MAKTTNKKTFVLDTNVILHDYRSIYNFENNDIVIPITVLEELDKFKRGNDQINYHAREFVRELDQISGEDFFKAGAPLGKGRGRLFIQTGVPFSAKMNDSFSEDIPDHRILAIAEHVASERKGEKVVLVSKDMNLRMKARSLGILAEDYKTDQVKNLEVSLNKCVLTREDFSPELIAKLYESGEAGVPVETFFPRVSGVIGFVFNWCVVWVGVVGGVGGGGGGGRGGWVK